jgi:hypothetical protein
VPFFLVAALRLEFGTRTPAAKPDPAPATLHA